MGKVICFYTRKELNQPQQSVSEGEALIENLLKFEMSRSTNPFTPSVELISNVISMVENNSGASRYDVMNKIYKDKKA